MNKLIAFFAAVLAVAMPASLAAQPDTTNAAGAESQEAMLRRIADQLHPVTGDVRIAEANAVLRLGEDYYFLPADEARLVLTEAWGNPPQTVGNVLGMVFPAGRTFSDDTWGAVITYEATGYVSDSDAASVDYAELLTTLRGDETAINAERARQGFPATHLVGWAQQPAYDAGAHSVVWALDVEFAGQAENTLNYDVRLLGRRGVLSLNMITVMSKLEETREAARRFAASAEYTSGSRYADYQAGDHTAEYGIAGLIAASVGATVAKKAGLIALILAFGKKFVIFIIAGIALAWRWIRKLFGTKTGEDEGAVYYENVTPEESFAEPSAEDDNTAQAAAAPPPPEER